MIVMALIGMAWLARVELFAADEIAIVHVMNRTVRRCFLLGDDPFSGKNFDHRKQWLDEQLIHQARHFGIDLLCQAILSNHFHLVLRSRPDVVAGWDDSEVARRWLMLCPERRPRNDVTICGGSFQLPVVRIPLRQTRLMMVELLRKLCDLMPCSLPDRFPESEPVPSIAAVAFAMLLLSCVFKRPQKELAPLLAAFDTIVLLPSCSP